MISIFDYFVILACTVLIQYSSVRDGRTDGQTDRQTPRSWLWRAKHSAIARKNAAQTKMCGMLRIWTQPSPTK